jgi:MFS family permease
MISKLGDAITAVALPITAITVLGATPLEVGLIGASQFVPIVLFSLPAGALVDRWQQRRRVMLVADLARAVVLLGLPILYFMGHLATWHLAVAAAILGLLGAFGDVATSSYVPLLVGTARLVVANGRLELGRSLTLVAGPASAAALIAAAGPVFALAADGLSFALSAVAIATIRFAEPLVGKRASSLLVGVTAGVRFVLKTPYVAAITATAGINNLSRSIAVTALFLVLLGGGTLEPSEVALGIGLGNTGFLAGALLAPRVTPLLGVGRTMILAVAMFGPAMLVTAAAPPLLGLPALVITFFFNGAGIAIHNVSQVSMRQALTPDDMRARVASATRIVIIGALPAGAALAGVLGQTFGPHAALWVGTIGLFAGPIPYAAVRIHRVRTLEGLAAPIGVA